MYEKRKSEKRRENGKDVGTRPRKEGIRCAKRKDRPCFYSRMTLVLVVILLFAPMFVLGTESSGESSTLNLSPQNDKVAVFTDSMGGVYYCEFLGIILNRSVLRMVQGGTSAADALVPSSIFSKPGNECGIIITNYGSIDVARDYPWEQIERDVGELFRRLKATGAIVVYNQIPPENEYPLGRICEEEGVIRVPEHYWIDDIWKTGEGFSIPWGRSHPGPWGSFVLAERTARVMLDAGIVDWVEPCEMDSLNFAGLYSNASQLIDEVEELDSNSDVVDVDIEGVVQFLALAEPLHEKGACFTTRWLLRDWIMDPLTITVERWDDILKLASLWERDFGHTTMDWPLREWTPDNLEGYPLKPPQNLSKETLPYRLDFVLEKWDEIQDMMAQATECIETLKAEGNTRDAAISGADYDRALKAWAEYEYDSTRGYLEKITAKCPEPMFIPALSLVLLTLLLRGSRDKTS
jgi:hypothetical protein